MCFDLGVEDPAAVSREEFLALLAAKDARIDALLVQVGELTAQVQALVLRLDKDSSTSSKPPSSDGPNRRPRGGSSRTKTGRKPGKQAGTDGTALRQVENPQERILIPAPAACGCGTRLLEAPVTGVRHRQVFDLPPREQRPAMIVTEYAADLKDCPGCGKTSAGLFPETVRAPAQYGPGVATAVAGVVLGHHVPVHRSTILIMELLGVQVSTGYAASIRDRAVKAITGGGFLDAVRALLAAAPVVHADETFARAAGSTTFVHVACTQFLSLFHTGDRSSATIDAGQVLDQLGSNQVLVRDGYAGYTHLQDVVHAWCCAHLLRDLRGIYQNAPADPDAPGSQVWAKAMADTLLHAHHLAQAARQNRRQDLTPDDLAAIRDRYNGALALFRTENPASNTSILAGHARTLARRFDTHRDIILRFASDLRVPFTNNEAERTVRVVKVQQRSSGGTWRTLQGLADFAVVQSYLSTAIKWGLTRWQALHQLFTTGPWIPPALTPAPA
jgi:transposase